MAQAHTVHAIARAPTIVSFYNNNKSCQVSSKPTTISNVSSKKSQKIPRLNIRCARVGGVEIPNQKRIETSLQYIHGIGRTRARKILLDLQLENKRTKDLSQDELIKLRKEVTEYEIEGDLRRFNDTNIRKLIEIRSYRGRRHMRGLPCRGQRTRNNCRTLKGRRISVAKKKKTPSK